MIQFLSRAFGGDKAEKPKAGKRINLALQGGGALGAFTWGVLDHLLEDGRLTIEGISGASAGAVNAILLADGLAEHIDKMPSDQVECGLKARTLEELDKTCDQS